MGHMMRDSPWHRWPRAWPCRLMTCALNLGWPTAWAFICEPTMAHPQLPGMHAYMANFVVHNRISLLPVQCRQQNSGAPPRERGPPQRNGTPMPPPNSHGIDNPVISLVCFRASIPTHAGFSARHIQCQPPEPADRPQQFPPIRGQL